MLAVCYHRFHCYGPVPLLCLLGGLRGLLWTEYVLFLPFLVRLNVAIVMFSSMIMFEFLSPAESITVISILLVIY